MGIYFSSSGNPEVWASKPDTYSTVSEYLASNPTVPYSVLPISAAGVSTATIVNFNDTENFLTGSALSTRVLWTPEDGADSKIPLTDSNCSVDYFVTAEASHKQNLLLNPGFTINQRAFSNGGTAGSANAYSVDMWMIQTSGQALSWTATSSNAYTVTAPAGGIKQIIEGASIVDGYYRLSWTGTATATINGTAVTNGNAINISNSGSSIYITFAGGTVYRPVLTYGSKVKPEWIPRPYSVELDMCQRYYRKMTVTLSTYCAASGSGKPLTYIPFSKTMYATPTIATVTAPTYTNSSAITAANITADGFLPTITATAAGTVTATSWVFSATANVS